MHAVHFPIINFSNRIIFAIFFVLNLVLWAEKSSAAIPFGTLVALLALWFGISVPLVFVGAYFGFRKPVSYEMVSAILLGLLVQSGTNATLARKVLPSILVCAFLYVCLFENIREEISE